MVVEVFLQVDGIDGESLVRGFERQVEVLSWTWGVSSAAGGHGGAGSAAGRAEQRDLVVEHRVDAASTAFVQACVRGTHAARAVLSVVVPGERPRTLLTLALTEVRVTSTVVSGALEHPVQTVVLTGRGVEVRYVEPTADGSAGRVHETVWDPRTT